jgi:hypothetical protein
VLHPWLLNISAVTPDHEIERLLRANLRARIDEVARWVPAPLRPAVRWTALLVDLPAIEELLRGGKPERWLYDEELLREMAAAEPRQRRAAFARQPRFAPLARGLTEQPMIEHWLAEWWRRLPPLDRDERRRLERLVRAARALVATPPADATPDAGEARALAASRFTSAWRRGFLRPSAVFAHLLLVAGEFLRVRGELMARKVFATEDR